MARIGLFVLSVPPSSVRHNMGCRGERPSSRLLKRRLRCRVEAAHSLYPRFLCLFSQCRVLRYKARERTFYFFFVPSWWRALEISRILKTQLPPIFAYTSNVAHIQLGRVSADVRQDRTGLLAAAMSEFVVVVFLSSFMAAREDVKAKQCFDPRLHVETPEVYGSFMPCAVPLVSSAPHPTGSL